MKGETQTIPISSLSTQQQKDVLAFVGDEMSAVMTDARGESREIFNRNDLQSKGMLQLAPAGGGDGSGPGLMLTVYTVPGFGGPGRDLLHSLSFPELGEERAQAAARRESEQNSSMAEVSGVATVTIERDLEVATPEEPPLAAYLGAYAKQTGLTVLAWWPPHVTAATSDAYTAKLWKHRLPKSIRKRPLAEAMNAICKAYGLRWTMEGRVVRVWAIKTASGRQGAGRTEKRGRTR
jgi:hypothetical protein